MSALRGYIRALLEETNPDSDSVWSPGGESSSIEIAPGEYGPMKQMALMVDGARHSTMYLLYKPRYYAQKIKEEIQSAREHFGSIRFKDKLDDFKRFYSFSNVRDVFRDPEGIYGYLRITDGRQLGLRGTCNKANEITHISAREGYSTFMYEIALIKHSPIMPDRSGTSRNAKKMWLYLANERSDVEKDPFKDETGLHKKTEDDCQVYGYRPLDQSYSSDQKFHLENLKQKHDIFIHQMNQYFKLNKIDFIKSRIDEYLEDAGKIFYESDEEGWGIGKTEQDFAETPDTGEKVIDAEDGKAPDSLWLFK
jgi:hypothetical protein